MITNVKALRERAKQLGLKVRIWHGVEADFLWPVKCDGKLGFRLIDSSKQPNEWLDKWEREHAKL